MEEEKEYPESLKKLLAANDELHEAVGEILADEAFEVYNKCAAAEQFRRAFSQINTAKAILGYEKPTPPSEPETPEPEPPPEEPEAK